MICRECENSRGSGGNMIYCRLFGIFVRNDYDGCKYHREGGLNEQVQEPESGDTGRHV